MKITEMPSSFALYMIAYAYVLKARENESTCFALVEKEPIVIYLPNEYFPSFHYNLVERKFTKRVSPFR
jgi:hypothetical protein